jgi:hypothetical protein
MEKKLRGAEHHKLIAVANNYNYSLSRIREIKQNKYPSASEGEILKLYVQYVNEVERVFRLFNLLELSMLQKEYFTPLPKGWWTNLYPKSTFYRIRLSTTKRFLEEFTL